MPSWSSVRLAGRCDCSTIRMISSFSDAGYLIRRRPHPQSCFFEQTVFECQVGHAFLQSTGFARSEEHTSELQSLMRISYAVFCLKKKNKTIRTTHSTSVLR